MHTGDNVVTSKYQHFCNLNWAKARADNTLLKQVLVCLWVILLLCVFFYIGIIPFCATPGRRLILSHFCSHGVSVSFYFLCPRCLVAHRSHFGAAFSDFGLLGLLCLSVLLPTYEIPAAFGKPFGRQADGLLVAYILSLRLVTKQWMKSCAMPNEHTATWWGGYFLLL